MCSTCVQLVRVSSFRNDLLQNPYILQFTKNYKMSKCLKFMVTYLIFFGADVTMCKKSNFVFDKIWKKKHLQKSDTLAKYEKENQY